MGAVQLPDYLREVIDRQVAQGRAPNADAYLAEAVRRYADELDADDELAAIAQAGIADMQTGTFKTLESGTEVWAHHDRVMLRIAALLTSNPAGE